MWSKWQFFDFFSKMALTIWLKLGQNVEGIISDHFQKTACRNLFWFIHKVWKSAENDGFLTFSQKWLVRFVWNLARMWKKLFLTICKKLQAKSFFWSSKKSQNVSFLGKNGRFMLIKEEVFFISLQNGKRSKFSPSTSQINQTQWPKPCKSLAKTRG